MTCKIKELIVKTKNLIEKIKFLEFEHLDVVVKNNSLTSDLYQVRKNLGSQNEVFP